MLQNKTMVVSIFNFLLIFAGSMTHAQQVSMKTVEIEWESVPGAESYEIKLTPTTGEAPSFFTSLEPHLLQLLPVGVYELRIRSRGKEQDEYSPWSEPVPLEVLIKEVQPLSPENHAVIEAKNKLTDVVEFSWTPVEKVKDYRITIWTNEIKDKPFSFTTRDTKKKLTVKTGREYFWEVSFESSNDISYAQRPPVFGFTLMGPKLISPFGLKITTKQEERICEWVSSEGASEYKAKLYFRYLDEKEFRQIQETLTKEHVWNLGHLKAGAYKIEVSAQAPKHLPSTPATLEFTVKPTEAELPKL